MSDVLALEKAKTLLSLSETESDPQALQSYSDQQPAIDAGYRFTLLLGRSAYNEVYRAVCTNTDRDVVLKLAYPSDRITSGEQAELVINTESVVLSKLAGPSVVPMIDAENAGFGSFLVTQYVGESDLLTYCRDISSGLAECAEVFRLLLKSLASIHKRGWVHGDLKPQHVLVDCGHPVLIDFGLAATVEGGLVKSRFLGGTPGYIAPEIVSGEATRPDPAQDVYSLGRMVEEMTAIHAPARPKRIRRLIDRATHPDPARRHQDAAEFQTDLDYALSSQPSRAAYFTAACVIACASLTPVLIAWPGDGDEAQAIDADRVTEGPDATFPYIAGLIPTDPQKARRLIAQLPEELQRTWEAGHLDLAAQTDGVALPYGPDPFGKSVGMSPRFHPETSLLVWGEPDGKVYRMDGDGRRLIGDFPPEAYTFSLDLHPAGDEALLCTATGSVFILSPDGPVLLPVAEQAIKAWYSSDGTAVYAHSRDRAELLLIDRASQRVRWRLSTAGAAVLHAASDPDDVALFQDLGGSWSMTRVDQDGSSATPLALPNIEQNVLSYDRDPGQDRVAIGTYQGIIHVHHAGAWRQMRCSESMQVYQVRLVPSQDRLFAATPADIEVFDLSSGLATITLGGRSTYHRGVQRIDWYEAERSLIATSARGVTAWSAGPSP